MKSFLWIFVIFLAITYLGKFLSPPALIVLGLIIAGVFIFSRRVTILTYLASQAYFIKNDNEKAFKRYKAAYDTGMMKSSDKVSFAAFCLYTDRLERCRRLLNEIINSSRSKENDRANAKHYMAILAWKEDDLDEAISIMKDVHQDYPSSATYGSMGVFYLEKAKKDGALQDILDFMLEAYDYNSSDKTIADNLGELYLELGEYEKAKEVYENLLSSEQISPVPYYNYALLLEKLGDTEKARENLNKALSCRFNRTLTITREDIESKLSQLN